MVGRHVHYVRVAQPSFRPESRVVANDLRHQLVRMEAPLHEDRTLPFPDEPDCLGRRGVAVRGVHDPESRNIYAVFRGYFSNSSFRAHKHGFYEVILPGGHDGPQRRLVARVRDRGARVFELGALLYETLVLIIGLYIQLGALGERDGDLLRRGYHGRAPRHDGLALLVETHAVEAHDPRIGLFPVHTYGYGNGIPGFEGLDEIELLRYVHRSRPGQLGAEKCRCQKTAPDALGSEVAGIIFCSVTLIQVYRIQVPGQGREFLEVVFRQGLRHAGRVAQLYLFESLVLKHSASHRYLPDE